MQFLAKLGKFTFKYVSEDFNSTRHSIQDFSFMPIELQVTGKGF